MIRPVKFGFNTETAASNIFQQTSTADAHNIQLAALQEFDNMVLLLKEYGVDVIVIDDTAEPHTPDSIFPNNWISFHANGEIILYPMQAPNRRGERRKDIIELLKQKGFIIKDIMDISGYEKEEKFLEGTGSMILDRENNIIYACLSPRTNSELLEKIAQHIGYKFIAFHAVDKDQIPIYHTNVLMSVGKKFAAVCTAAIRDENEKNNVIQSLQNTGKEIIDLSFDQLYHFAGNMLAIQNHKQESLIVMSEQAFHSLTNEQVRQLSRFGKILHPSLSTIETIGGGSARCMMAEIFLPHL